MTMELFKKTASELSAMLQSKEISSVELTQDVLENGNVTVFVKSGGVTQKFLFTKL